MNCFTSRFIPLMGTSSRSPGPYDATMLSPYKTVFCPGSFASPYRLEVVVDDLSLEAFCAELEVQFSVTLRRDLPASECS